MDEYDDYIPSPPPLPESITRADLPGPSFQGTTAVTISSFDTCKTVKIKANQVNSQVLGKVFSFFPDSIFLISDSGNVVTASSQGNFEISVSNAREGWTCHGDSIKPPQPQLPIDQGKELQYCYQGRTHGKAKATPSKWIPHYSTSKKLAKPPGVLCNEAEWMKTVGIYSFADGGYEKVGNFPVRLTEEKANISYVKKVVSEESFKGKDVVIVDVDFLKIPDTSSTRGSLFWKNPNKKISAILEEDYSRGTYAKTVVAGTKRSHSDDSKHKVNFEERLRRIEKTLEGPEQRDKILSLEAEVASLNLKLTRANDIIERVLSTFKCMVCMKCPILPAYQSPCCEEVLGCYNCIQQWLETHPSCPLCRASLSPDGLINIPSIRSLLSVLSEVQQCN